MKQTLAWVTITLVIVGGFTWYALKNKTTVDTGPSKYDAFAQCLATKKVTMYGAAWCSHCQAQKKEFGSAFHYVPYVECPDNIALCKEKGVEGFPTWITDDGKKLVGEQPLSKLAEVSGCQLPQ